jgi:hypothetical protein
MATAPTPAASQAKDYVPVSDLRLSMPVLSGRSGGRNFLMSPTVNIIETAISQDGFTRRSRVSILFDFRAAPSKMISLRVKTASGAPDVPSGTDSRRPNGCSAGIHTDQVTNQPGV